jgi:formylglycine-generating enzyme required for sulfatase activity
MKFGPTTKRAACKLKFLVAPFVATALALLPACGPKTPPASAQSDPPASAPAKPAPNLPPNMVLIPGGTFIMGDKSDVDAPPHEVAVSSFFMDTNLVTQQFYQKIIGNNPSRWKAGNNPVEQVRWSDAVQFCNHRSQLEGLQPCYDPTTWKCNFHANGYRLPTEAEWEYACRAGAATTFFFGDNSSQLGDYAWFDKNAGGHPQPVGHKMPNAWGLYDICGNVWQWCNDFYQVDYYLQAPRQDPAGPDSGKTKVLRGGAWRFDADSCRAAYRYNENPGYADVCFGYDIYGFRCVRRAAP